MTRSRQYCHIWVWQTRVIIRLVLYHVLPLQAIANESGINFISVKGPELLNMVSSVTWWSKQFLPCPVIESKALSSLFLCRTAPICFHVSLSVNFHSWFMLKDLFHSLCTHHVVLPLQLALSPAGSSGVCFHVNLPVFPCFSPCPVLSCGELVSC